MTLSKWVQKAVICGCGALAWSACGQADSKPSFDLEAIDNHTVRISWTNDSTGFILQESDSPSASARWSGVLQNPVLNGNNASVTRSLSGDWTRWFFRIRAKGVYPGLDYLNATQSPSGTWGDPNGTLARDTATVLDALGLYGQNINALGLGISGLYALATRNNDEAARKTAVLAAHGYDVGSLLTDLLASQGAAVQDATAIGYPGRGWGLAAGFGNSTIDTALVIRALNVSGRAAGLCSFRESVSAGSTSPAHPFAVPSGGNSIVLKIRNVTGATLRFLMTPPAGGAYYVDISPRTTVYDIVGFPFVAGTWNLQVQNSGAVSGSYIAEVGFNDASGFDSFRYSSALTYLALAQNADGGWGIAPGEDSQLMISAEVLRIAK